MSADGAQLLLISHYSLLIDLRLLGMTRVYKLKSVVKSSARTTPRYSRAKRTTPLTSKKTLPAAETARRLVKQTYFRPKTGRIGRPR